MEYVNFMAVVTIKHTARGFYDLPVAGPLEFQGAAATFGMLGQLRDMSDNSMHQPGCCNRIFKCNEIGYSV